jgi:hypothetical protein
MQIELTKEQYKNLIRMVNTTNNILGLLSDHIEDERYKTMSKEAEEIENYLFGFAKDFECDDLVENWEGKIILSDKTSEQFHEILDDYDDFILFDSLVNKLAWRDFYRDHSEPEIKEMAKRNKGYFGVELYDYEKKYWDEFEKYGYDRLEIKKD